VRGACSRFHFPAAGKRQQAGLSKRFAPFKTRSRPPVSASQEISAEQVVRIDGQNAAIRELQRFRVAEVHATYPGLASYPNLRVF
jgi:hypothetical protein